MAYPVTSAINSMLVAFYLPIPFNDWIIEALQNQIMQLATEPIWDENPFATQDEIEDTLLGLMEGMGVIPLLTGQIVCYPLSGMEAINRDPSQGESGLLPCDGATYNTSDWPNLFAVIGYSFGGSGSTFSVPDLRGRVLINADDMDTGRGAAGIITASWASSINGQGGETVHELTINEMPSHNHTSTPHTHTLSPHSHSESGAIANATTIGAGAPQPTALPSPSVTGLSSDGISSDAVSINDTGNSDSHNNVQASATMFWYIVGF